MLSNTQVVTRGTSVYWTTTFYDVNKNIAQPGSATINILYSDPESGNPVPVQVAMTPPAGAAVTWTALWDTRGTGAGNVSWSIHSDPGPPFAVEDGNFTLTANAANLVTFA